jgi:hypothetical protein
VLQLGRRLDPTESLVGGQFEFSRFLFGQVPDFFLESEEPQTANPALRAGELHVTERMTPFPAKPVAASSA